MWFVTWRATSVWLYAPLLPQSPTTRRLRDPSALAACSNRWSSAAERRAEKPRRTVGMRLRSTRPDMDGSAGSEGERNRVYALVEGMEPFLRRLIYA